MNLLDRKFLWFLIGSCLYVLCVKTFFKPSFTCSWYCTEMFSHSIRADEYTCHTNAAFDSTLLELHSSLLLILCFSQKYVWIDRRTQQSALNLEKPLSKSQSSNMKTVLIVCHHSKPCLSLTYVGIIRGNRWE